MQIEIKANYKAGMKRSFTSSELARYKELILANNGDCDAALLQLEAELGHVRA